jgi:hypothetical protein
MTENAPWQSSKGCFSPWFRWQRTAGQLEFAQMRTGKNRLVPRTIMALLMFVASVAVARAELRIVSSPGGEVGSYLRLFAMVRQSGERVIIDGPCLSACTLVLSSVPEDRICITRRAILGFHAARRLDEGGQLYAAPHETRLLAATYPTPIRSWIERNGGLTEKPLFLRSRQLAAFYRICR